MSKLTQRTIKLLFSYSRNRCAYPPCTSPLVQVDPDVVIGDVCHIKAESKAGPRYDPKQTPQERSSFENLILLCKNHHQMIDAVPDTYTVNVLSDMKAAHEAGGALAITPETIRMTSLLCNNNSSISVRSGRDSQVMLQSPGGLQAKTINATGPFVFTKKHTTRSVIHPGPEHITDEQAAKIKAIIDQLADIDVTAGRPDSHSGWYSRLYRKFRCRNSYHLIYRDDFPEVMAYLRMEVAKARPKLRRTDNNEWRKRFYGAIWAKASELRLSRDQVHQLATERLKLQKPLRSLTDLGEQNLEKLYRMMKAP